MPFAFAVLRGGHNSMTAQIVIWWVQFLSQATLEISHLIALNTVAVDVSPLGAVFQLLLYTNTYLHCIWSVCGGWECLTKCICWGIT
jgi:hypothetical protein